MCYGITCQVCGNDDKSSVMREMFDEVACDTCYTEMMQEPSSAWVHKIGANYILPEEKAS